ncbi:MAG: hypothetical protein LBH11_05770 [Propionibacteriaceae bacterium]|jgi:hypothetical protein|nr:hypothetical protein [Propionibacteriaceae bacterium]
MTDSKPQSSLKGLRRTTDGRDGISALVNPDRALRARELMAVPAPLSPPSRTLAERASGKPPAPATSGEPRP